MCHIAEDSRANEGLHHALYSMFRKVSPPSSGLGEGIAGHRIVSSSEVLQRMSVILLLVWKMTIHTLNILERTHICGSDGVDKLIELASRYVNCRFTKPLPNLSGQRQVFRRVMCKKRLFLFG
jgi:hypothetical protein